MKTFKQIKDLFTRTDVNALFSALETAGAPWADETKPLQYVSLGTLYWLRSRKKLVTSFIEEEIEDSDADLDDFAGDLLTLYGDKWVHLWELFLMEYNPIENYNMTEEGGNINTKTGSLDRSGAITRSGDLTRSGAITRSGKERVGDKVSYVGKEIFTPSGKVIDSGLDTDNQSTTDNSIYGYNSSNPVNADKTIQKTGHKNERTYANNYKEEKSFSQDRADNRAILTEYENVKDEDTRKETYNNIADTDSRKETYNNIKDTGSHNLTRSGNIGVTTTQQMAESEIEYRRHLYFEMVFGDIDKLLTLPIY